MDVEEVVAELRRFAESARSRPMSGSAVVNRSELLDLVGRLEKALGSSGGGARKSGAAVVSGASDDGGGDAEKTLAEARAERDRLVTETEVFRVAKLEADQLRDRARRECEELRRDTDEYVDTRLAGFEVALGKIVDAVTRGRERLHSRSHFGELAQIGEPAQGTAREPQPGTESSADVPTGPAQEQADAS